MRLFGDRSKATRKLERNLRENRPTPPDDLVERMVAHVGRSLRRCTVVTAKTPGRRPCRSSVAPCFCGIWRGGIREVIGDACRLPYVPIDLEVRWD